MTSLLAAPAAFAQSQPDAAAGQAAPAQAEPDPAANSEIIVTGTRVARAGYTAPTPMTVVGEAQIQAMAPATIADFVNQLPALAGSTTPRTTGPVSGDGLGGVNFLNLRNLGPVRTLTLLDGRRVVASATIGAVDINLLPTALIKRVDIVTGGASAAWGSDAIAGVVNFILDDKFEGVKAEIQRGISSRGDGATWRAEASFGTAFAGGRGHLVLSGSYGATDSIDSPTSRGWYKAEKFIANPAYVAGNGQPKLILAPNVGLSVATTGGLITAGPLRGTQFLPGGTPAPFTFGSVSNFLMLGGTPNDISNITQLQAALKQTTAFANLDFDVSDNVTVYGQFNYGRAVSDTISVPYFRLGNITIQSDNAYLDPVTRQAMATAGVTSFTMGRTNYDFGPALAHNVRTLYRGVGGIKGTFGKGWSWDIYYEYGQSKIKNLITVDPIVSRYNLATDAVINPANGQVVCRSTLTAPTNGCVPVNLFGAGSPSQAARNYILGQALQNTRLTQQVTAASLRGEPFSTWAGPVSFAAGAEYRTESFVSDADPVSIATDFWAGNFKPSSGHYNVKEGFAEFVVPLLHNVPFFKSFDINGAARVTDYSTSGSVVTWKAGLTWDISNDIRLRGTRSRDIRAPNLNDLFLASSTRQESVNDPQHGNQSVLARRVTTGNPALKPEIANAYTAGIVLKPSWLDGFDMSVDYFNIRIDDAITTLTSQQVVNQCAAGVTALCNSITRDANGVITQIITTGINVQSEKTSGIDFEARYHLPLSHLSAGWNGSLTFQSLVTFTHDRSVTILGVKDERAGQVSDYALPKWRGQMSATYMNGPLTTTLRARYIGSGVFSNLFTSADIANNHVPAVVYIDLSASHRFKLGHTSMELFGVVENLFDKAPPSSPALTGNTQSLYGVNPALYDTIGTMFRFGVRLAM